MRFFLLLLLFAAPLHADDLTIHGETKVIDVDRTIVVKEKMTLVSALPFRIEAPAGALAYVWTVPQGVTWADKDDSIEISNAPKGQITIGVRIKYAAIVDEKIVVTPKTATLTFIIGEVVPPKPPDPPTPKVVPLAVDGMAAFVVWETADKLPEAQQAILTSTIIRDYLNAKCAVDPSNPSIKAYRLWDKDLVGDNIANEHQVWRDAMARKRDSLPWIIVSNKTNGKAFEGPLPADVNKTLELLKQIGE